jgi:hypothetical protein
MSYSGYSNSPSYVASGAAGSVVNSAAGNYGQSNFSGVQSQAQAQTGLQGFSGLSGSSEAIDFNSLGPIGYPTSSGTYGGVAPYGSYGAVSSLNCAPSQPLDVNDPNLLAQVEQIVQSLNEVKRPMLRRQVVTVPAAYQGRVAHISRRLPTPPPDIIERITVVKPPRDVVNLSIEKPCQPGPCFQQRQICGKPRRPIIHPRVIPVVPRSNPCAPPPPPPPQPTYVPPQPVYVPPQPVCYQPPPPQPVCIPPPPPQPVCIPPPPPQPVCLPPQPQACVPQPQPCVQPYQSFNAQTSQFFGQPQAAFGQFAQSAGLFQQNQFGAYGQPNYYGSGFGGC